MEELKAMMEKLSADVKSGLAALETKLEATQSTVDSTAATISNLDSWKSEVDTQVFDLTAFVESLRKQVGRGSRPERAGSRPGCCRNIIDLAVVHALRARWPPSATTPPGFVLGHCSCGCPDRRYHH